MASNDNNNNDDDLYGDLDFSLQANPKKPRPLSAIATTSTTGAFTSMHSKQLQELQKQIEQLQEENQRLKRNIGTLFRTAKNEIQRKDFQIERLQRELDQKV